MKQTLVGLLEVEIDIDDSGLSISQKSDFSEDGYIYIPTEYIDLFIQKIVKAKGENHGR